MEKIMNKKSKIVLLASIVLLCTAQSQSLFGMDKKDETVIIVPETGAGNMHVNIIKHQTIINMTDGTPEWFTALQNTVDTTFEKAESFVTILLKNCCGCTDMNPKIGHVTLEKKNN